MNRRKSNAGAIGAVLVIIAMVVGILIGILIGRTMASKDSDTAQTGQPAQSEDTSGEDSLPESELVTETVPETLENGSQSETGAVVISVNGRELTMEEINYYMYQQRDYFVNIYGEEPWGVTMDDGQTVAEYAKQQMYDEIVRTQILVDQAANYGVEMTDEMKAQYADDAQSYVDKLGPEICEQFGLNASAIAQVYQDAELGTAVYNAILGQLSTEMRADSNYSSLSDEEFESAVNDAYAALFDGWKSSADIQTTEIWDTIVVGSVG